IRCKTVASFLARATLARFTRRRLATSSAQRLSVENRVVRLSSTLAASYKAVRTIASPTLLTPPVTSVSPDWYFFGVSPKCAPTALEEVKRAGSSTVAVKVTATSGPTPGTVIRRRHTASSRRSEEHTSELQSRQYLVCRLLLEKKKKMTTKQLSGIRAKARTARVVQRLVTRECKNKRFKSS